MALIFNIPVNLLLANCEVSEVHENSSVGVQKYGVTEKILSVTLTKTNDYQFLESILKLPKDWSPGIRKN